MENFRKTPSENLSWETDSRFMAKFGGKLPKSHLVYCTKNSSMGFVRVPHFSPMG